MHMQTVFFDFILQQFQGPKFEQSIEQQIIRKHQFILDSQLYCLYQFQFRKTMLPFHIPNGYLNPQYSFNMNYDIYRLAGIQGNSFINPYNYQNYNFLYETATSNYVAYTQQQNFLEKNAHCSPIQQAGLRKRKRITKKLAFTQVKKKIRPFDPKLKSQKKIFKYFDPSRAPPITSLRNIHQLALDLQLQEQKFENANNEQSNYKLHQGLQKLEIILREPNERNYPFLICKKRTYHRNLKRRYSVAYFERRASYINKKEPIPASLHPKNKVRRPRCLKKSLSEVSQSGQQSSDSQYSVFSQKDGLFEQKNPEFAVNRVNVVNKTLTNNKQIKQEDYDANQSN